MDEKIAEAIKKSSPQGLLILVNSLDSSIDAGILKEKIITALRTMKVTDLMSDTSKLLDFFMDFLQSRIGDNKEIEETLLSALKLSNQVEHTFSLKELERYLNILSLLKGQRMGFKGSEGAVKPMRSAMAECSILYYNIYKLYIKK